MELAIAILSLATAMASLSTEVLKILNERQEDAETTEEKD